MKLLLIFCAFLCLSPVASFGAAKSNVDSLVQRKVDSLVAEREKGLRQIARELEVDDKERRAETLANEARDRIDDASNLLEWAFGGFSVLVALLAALALIGVWRSRVEMKKNLQEVLQKFKLDIIEPETTKMINDAKAAISLQQKDLHDQIARVSNTRVEDVIKELQDRVREAIERQRTETRDKMTPLEKLSGEAEEQLKQMNEKLAQLELLGGKLTTKDYIVRGDALRVQGDFELALEAYEHALILDDKDLYALFQKGSVLEKLRRFEEAVLSYKKFLGHNGDRWISAAHNNLGQALRALRRLEEALKEFDSAIELNRMDALPWIGKGSVLRNQGKYSQALVAYDKAIELDSSLAYPWIGKGMTLRYWGQYDKALQAIEVAIRLDDGQSRAWYDKGRILQVMEEPEKALAAYETAINIEYAEPIYVLGKAGTLFELDKSEEALRLVLEVLPRLDRDRYTAYSMARAYALWRDKTSMLRELRYAVTQTPSNKIWVCRDPDFKTYRNDPEFLAITGCRPMDG